MNLKIFTTVTNQPSFVELQAQTFKQFIKCEYEFHIVDDSFDYEQEYRKICKDHELFYHLKKEKIVPHDPMRSCAQAVQWTYDNLIRHCENNIVLFLDSDMFLLESFDPTDYMKDKIISASLQGRGEVYYLWNGIILLNMQEVLKQNGNLDFGCGMVDGEYCDVGGRTYYFLKENNIEVDDLVPKYEGEYKGIQLENMETFMDGKFFHFRTGTLWDKKVDVFERKVKIFQEILNSI